MVVARLLDAMDRARRGFDEAGDERTAATFMRTELKALQQMARVFGMERLVLTGSDLGLRLPTREEAEAALGKLDKNSGKK